jgi:hypothetical protein
MYLTIISHDIAHDKHDEMKRKILTHDENKRRERREEEGT